LHDAQWRVAAFLCRKLAKDLHLVNTKCVRKKKKRKYYAGSENHSPHEVKEK
jgi:hypothetical protein